jgi:CheY-like chemotaxis protein
VVQLILTGMIQGINKGRLDVVDTGEEAVSKAAVHTYDLILMDIGLPGIDGAQATTQIRAIEQEQTQQKKAMIIGATAYELADIMKPCLSAGMNAVFAKPIQRHLIQQLISACTQGHPITTDIIDQINYAYIEKLPIIQGEDPSGLLDLFAHELPEIKANMVSAMADPDMPRLYNVVQKIYDRLCFAPTPQLTAVCKAFKIALESATHDLQTLYAWMLKAIASFEVRYANIKAQG